jgi:ABC-type spermidine/putrescine transport system permease subunit II
MPTSPESSGEGAVEKERRARGEDAPKKRRLLALGATPLSIYLLLLLALPVGILVLYSVWTAGFFTVVRQLTLENYEEVLKTSTYRTLFLKTMVVGLVCATLLTGLGFALAYAITFKLGRWGSRVFVLVTVTLFASYLVRIYAWKAVLGDQGLTNRILLDLHFVDQPLRFLLYGYFAIVLTLIYVYLPFAVLLIYAGLQNIDRRVFEGSRDLGASRFRTLRKVTVPLAAPALWVTFAVCFILTTADYVTPQLVGGLEGQMVGRVISDQFGGGANYPLGAAMAVILVLAMALVLGLVFAATRGLGRVGRQVDAARRRVRTRTSAKVRSHRGPVGRLVHGAPYTEILSALLLAFLLVPLGVVIFFSFNSANVPGLPFKGFTLRWYGAVVRQAEFRSVLWTSVRVMVASVAVALLIGVPAAFAIVRRPFRLRGTIQTSVFGPIAIPGVVIGVALLTSFVFANVPLGLFTIIAAHILLIVPYVVLVVRGRLLDMDSRIEEAARDLGANPKRVFKTITLPLLLPSLLGAALLCAAISLDDVIVTNFLSGTNPTVPVWILGVMWRTFTPGVNAVAVLILFGSLSLIGIAALVFRRTRSAKLTEIVAGGHGV